MIDVCNQAKHCGMKIETVFDVGVADGTPELYESFPKARFILVEPLEEFDHSIKEIAKTYNTTLIQAAASDFCGRGKIFINQKSLHGTSLLENNDAKEQIIETRDIELITLDAIQKEFDPPGPFLIKADVQGTEINVINGAKTLLNQTEMIILETSLYEFMDGGPIFHDVIFSMKDLGFVVYDFIGGSIRPYDGALGQIDIAFVKENGYLRNSNRYT